ncbi:4'-phosphopantetheinyl transferase family protein [Zavarzinia compransoris]|nr:4'-phosphopantetheinyl transferase superfamily protein [Zavarzinia compransoris]TDP47223.1 4'-phosphopantetheinyl transferase [Zavarzinia compransoris]
MSLAFQTDGARAPVAAPALAAGEVHAWIIDLELAAGTLEDTELLTSLWERERAARLRRPLDRRRFLRGRAALRRVLSTYAGRPPAGLVLAADDQGRPFAPDLGHFDFNSSRSGNYATIAIARGGRVGIDIEAVEPGFPCRQLARSFFSAAENEVLDRLPPDRLAAGFFQAWVSKEACVKAWGMGLSLPLAGFDVEADPARPPALLHHRQSEAPLWLAALAGPVGHAVALAADRPIGPVRIMQLGYHDLAAGGRA